MRVNEKRVRTTVFIGFGTVAFFILVACIFTFTNNSTRSPATSEASSIGEGSSDSNSVLEAVADTKEAVSPTNSIQLSEDVWEICGLPEFPTESEASKAFVQDLVITQDCLAALEVHTLETNPFERNGMTVVKDGPEFSLIVLDNPMTYKRIFTDPADDLQRIFEALSLPVCDWETTRGKQALKEVCHAEAFTNYATFYDACFSLADEKRTQAESYFDQQVFYVFEVQEPEPAEITDMWQGYLEFRWVDEKCQEFNSDVDLSAENYPREFEVLRMQSESRVSLFEQSKLLTQRAKDSLFSLPFTKYNLITLLLDIGAELGDEAAGLAVLDRGVFANKIHNTTWTELKNKRTLSTDRLRKALWFALALERKGVKLNWEWLVRHICSSQSTTESDQDATEHEDCRSAINDIYTKRVTSGHNHEDRLLVALDRFQRLAIELDVYE